MSTHFIIESEFPAGGKRTIHSVAVNADDAKEAIHSLAIRYVCDSTNVTSVTEVSVYETTASVPARVGVYAVTDSDKVKIVKTVETVDKGYFVNGKKLESSTVGIYYSIPANLDVVPVGIANVHRAVSENSVKTLETLRKEFDSTTDENARLHSELAVVNSKFANRVAYIEKLEADLFIASNPPHLVSKISHLECEVSGLSAQLDEGERRYSTLVAALNGAANETQTALAKIERKHEEEVKDYNRKIGTLSSTVRILTADKDSLNKYIDDLNELMRTTEKQYQTTLNNLEITTSDLHLAQDENQVLSDRLDSLELHLETEKAASKAVRTAIDNVNAALQRAREDNLNLREELLKLREQSLADRPLPPPPPLVPTTLKKTKPSGMQDGIYDSVISQLKMKFSPPARIPGPTEVKQQEVVPAPEWMITDPAPTFDLPTFSVFGSAESSKCSVFDAATRAAAEYARAKTTPISNPFGDDGAPLLSFTNMPCDSDFDSLTSDSDSDSDDEDEKMSFMV